MTGKIRVLFVCTANAARSQLAEALLRHTDPVHFEAFSAGTKPGQVDPRTYDALEYLDIDTKALRSKSIDEFAGERFDYVITLCDKAAHECLTLPAFARYWRGTSKTLSPVTNTMPSDTRFTRFMSASRCSSW